MLLRMFPRMPVLLRRIEDTPAPSKTSGFLQVIPTMWVVHPQEFPSKGQFFLLFSLSGHSISFLLRIGELYRRSFIYDCGHYDHNMKGIIVMFRMPARTPNSVVSAFCKKFYGQDTSSHKGKYRYHRRGLLDDIPHRRFIRQVVIIRTEDAEKVIDFLSEYNARVYTRIVELTREDARCLGL